MPPETTMIVCALIRRDGRLLLVEEMEAADPGPTWMLPGGRLEPGETLTDGLRRELAEETGLQLADHAVIAFAVDMVRSDGRYSAITFDCDGAGSVEPNDPDGLVLSAEWLDTDEALRRLALVDWYDCRPLKRFLSGEAGPGSVYVADAT